MSTSDIGNGYVFIISNPGTPGAVTLYVDAATSETHTYDAEVTDHNVETGSDVTDNVRVKPLTISITGVVTDSPLAGILRVRGGGDDDDDSPSETARQFLLNVLNAREPVTVATSLDIFENMVMSSLAFPRDSKSGNALTFTAGFKQIRFITNNRTTVKVAIPQAAAKRNLGPIAAKTAETTPTAKPYTSTFSDIVDGAGGDSSQKGTDRFVANFTNATGSDLR